MRLRIPPLLLGTTLFFAVTSARAVTFTTVRYPNNNLWSENGGINGHLRADLNGDGREDFISLNVGGDFNAGCPTSGFAITYSTADGTYAAPVCYTLPSGIPTHFAVGDFYQTGVLDVIVSNDSGLAYLYRNDGRGNLQLANNYTLDGVPAGMIAADVNHDGKIDLNYDLTDVNGGGGSSLHVLFGNGDGTFTTGPVSAFKFGGGPAGLLAVGDFDNDSHADFMVQGRGNFLALILYGDGKGDFTQGPQLGGSTAAFSPADIDDSGTMDLVGWGPAGSAKSKYLVIEYGHFNRIFTSALVPLKSCPAAFPVVADFDGDGIPDIVVVEDTNCTGSAPDTLNFLKGNGNGTFQPEQVIYSTADYIFTVDVMRASHSSKPDLTVWQTPLMYGLPTNPVQLVLVNSTAGNFPPCTPPNFRPAGINVCGPATTVVTSPVNLSFAGANQTPGRDMEIWIDGHKVAENLKNTYAHYGFISDTASLTTGQHAVAVFSVGWDYSLLLSQFTLNVGTGTCPVPAYTGLNVCGPIQNGTVSSPVTAWAAGNAGGPITRMEVWVDGVKEYSTFGSNTLQTQLNVSPGWHQFAFFLVSANGTKWLDIVWASVQ